MRSVSILPFNHTRESFRSIPFPLRGEINIAILPRINLISITKTAACQVAEEIDQQDHHAHGGNGI